MVSRFVQANEQQQSVLRGGTMELDMDASVPKLKKQGKLHALKNISKLGTITYHALGFSGDNMVKTEVIARYLNAELQANQGGTNFSITPQNYKFKYKGMENVNGRDVYILHVTPRQKKVGLFKGELWLDSQTYMPVRESGQFVKTPSIFLKKMEFVQSFEIQDGVSIPQKLESKADVRFFGAVQFTINYLKFSKEEGETVASGVTDQQ
jgi:outer membrane lipoprotein-sorting protein